MERKIKVTFVIAIFLVSVILASSMSGVMAGKPAAKECDDGIDNDGDGNIDLADAGCDDKRDNDETNCGDGVCEGGETPGSCSADCGEPDSCSDTDGGNFPWTFGTTSGYLNQAPYSNDDYCVDTDNVNEYYCAGDYETSQQHSCGQDEYYIPYCIGDSVYQDYIDRFCASGVCSNTTTPTLIETCEYGCTNGVCNPPPDSCTDSDGGPYPFVFGTVSGYSYGQPYSYDDVCNSTTIVMERYCWGTEPWIDFHDCSVNSTVCSNGACV